MIDRKETLEEVLRRIGVPMENPGTNARIIDHVRAHKYFLDRDNNQDTAWEDAVASWQLRVWGPLNAAVSDSTIKYAFPYRANDELFLEVADHWHYLKSEGRDIAPDEAALDYAEHRGNRFSRVLGAHIVEPLRQLIANNLDMDKGRRIDQNVRRTRTKYDVDYHIL